MVRRITEDDYKDFEYPSALQRIVKVAHDNGIILTPEEANRAWEEFSDSMCAGWMCLPDADIDIWYSLPSWARGESDE